MHSTAVNTVSNVYYMMLTRTVKPFNLLPVCAICVLLRATDVHAAMKHCFKLHYLHLSNDSYLCRMLSTALISKTTCLHGFRQLLLLLLLVLLLLRLLLLQAPLVLLQLPLLLLLLLLLQLCCICAH
jgi:hypothetical protein